MESRTDQPLEQRLAHVLADAEHLAGRFHLRAEIAVRVGELLKREHGHLDGEVRRRAVQPRAVAERFELLPDHHAAGQIDHRHAGDLADVRDRARRARVDLDDVQLAVVDQVLDVHQPLRAQRQRELRGVLDDAAEHSVGQVVRRIDGDGIARVDAGALDVLHHAGDQHVGAVGDDVDLQLDAGHVLVHEHRVVDAAGEDARHVALDVLRPVGDGHVLAADDVARPQQHRIAERLRRRECLVERAHAHALRPPNGEPLQQRVEPRAVLGDVDALGGGAEDVDPRAVERLRQPNRRLAAERHHDAHRLFDFEDAQHVLLGQRLKVEPVGGVVVGGDGLGIVVDDDDVVAHLLERPHAVHRGIVELNALPDADRPGAEHDDHRLARARERARLAFGVEGGVEVRRLGVELRAAGVDHLKRRPHLRQRLRPAQPAQRAVRIAELLAAQVALLRQPPGDRALVFGEMREFREEPAVDLRDLVDAVDGDAGLDGLEDRKQTQVVGVFQPLLDRQAARVRAVERVLLNLRAAHGLHQRHFKRRRDGHDLAGGLHLRAERAAGAGKLVKRPLRQFDHDVVQRGLEAGAGLAGDLVSDLVERIAQRDLRGDLCDGIAGGLARQRGRARHARVDLDDGIFKAVRVERKLAVAAADHAQRRDDVQRRAAQHLILPVRQRQRRRDDDGIAGVDADGIEVFHRADRDGVAHGVAHDLKLDLLPAGNVALDQHLMDRRHLQPRPRGLAKLLWRVGHAAARAAQRKRRAHNHWIADGLGDFERAGHVVGNFGGDGRLADGLHGLLEPLPVLGPVDRLGVDADQPHAVLRKKALLVQLHGKRQARLAAQPGEHAVRLFALDDALDRPRRQRLQIDLVRQRAVGHDRSGIGIHEHDVHACGLQHAAGLRAGIVELRRLSDDDWAGADHQHLADIPIQRHAAHLPSGRESGRTETTCRAARRWPRGGTAL